MFVDASALVAILLKEPEAPHLLNRMSDETTYTSPIAIFETVLALMKQRRVTRARAEQDVADLLAELGTGLVAISPEIGREALAAFEKYGKGRGHKAQLNMGDCFAYACAKMLDVPLLYKGGDFARTDLA